ncbi:hypothetical protein [Aquimarina agarivorans]|uniref:hypothetical protein n=1 Tax=Aquimarina agarivorans TaxID=980584 RepID=UPI000248F5AF|nr:hypothetical protein [Aquimarina agarivorans]
MDSFKLHAFSRAKLCVLFLFTVFISSVTYAQKKKSFVKFDNEPAMILSKRTNQFGNYQIAYFSKRSATIYLELVDKYDKVVGNSIVQLKGRKKGLQTLNIRIFPECKLISSKYYKYRLSMYEAPMHVWENKVTNIEVRGVQITSKI